MTMTFAIITGSASGIGAAAAPELARRVWKDIAETVLWLVEGARPVTGETMFVDSGMPIASPR